MEVVFAFFWLATSVVGARVLVAGLVLLVLKWVLASFKRQRSLELQHRASLGKRVGTRRNWRLNSCILHENRVVRVPGIKAHYSMSRAGDESIQCARVIVTL